MITRSETPLRPTQHAENIILTAILEGRYPPEGVLPAERILAEQVGVTRPTLRETLQRLAREGWITIRHGKPTKVNDYWNKGGLSLLGTITQYGQFLPAGFINHLMEFRVALMPAIARLAAARDPQKLEDCLKDAADIKDTPLAYTLFDWDLQMKMATFSGNPIYTLILNDFKSIYENMALMYFDMKKARELSKTFYEKLGHAIFDGEEAVEQLTRSVLEQGIDIWNEINELKGENPC